MYYAPFFMYFHNVENSENHELNFFFNALLNVNNFVDWTCFFFVGWTPIFFIFHDTMQLFMIF